MKRGSANNDNYLMRPSLVTVCCINHSGQPARRNGACRSDRMVEGFKCGKENARRSDEYETMGYAERRCSQPDWCPILERVLPGVMEATVRWLAVFGSTGMAID